MACYGCGGPDGSDARLCPECAKRKKEDRASIKPFLQVKTKQSDSLFDARILKYVFGAVIVALGVYLLCFSKYGPGFAISIPEQVYKQCMAKLQAELTVKKTSLASTPKKFAADMEGAMRGFGEKLCGELKKRCESDPKSSMCTAAQNIE